MSEPRGLTVGRVPYLVAICNLVGAGAEVRANPWTVHYFGLVEQAERGWIYNPKPPFVVATKIPPVRFRIQKQEVQL